MIGMRRRVVSAGLMFTALLFVGAALPLYSSRPEPGAPSNRLTDSPTILYVVRHAEKVDESPAADLNEAGRARAELLAWMLRDVSLDAVLSTDVPRTRSTVTPVAQAHKLEVASYSPAPGRLRGSLLGEYRGKCVLVGGHSNTIPQLLGELGTPIEEKILPGYDDLFLVVIPPGEGSEPVMHRLHYPAHR